MFATSTIAARIERAEAAVARDFGLLARARGADVLLEPIGGTTAVYGGPGQPYNKIAGLGFADLDEAALARLEAAYAARRAEIRVEQATLANPSVASLLSRRGYVLAGFENVLGLELTPEVVAEFAARRQADEAGGVTVARITPDETRLWVTTTAEGFMHPDTFDGPPPTETFDRAAIEDVFSDSGRVENCVLYLARRNGDIAGGGTLRIFDGLAQLGGASTLPDHRRRGVQSAMLRARLLDAAQTCDLAVVTTEPASKSQANVQRAGFQLLYARAILIKAAISSQL